MKSLLLVCLILGLLSFHSFSYSLQGRWSIKPSYLPTDVNASITFEKSLNSTDSHIVYYMNVFACRLFRYKYIVVDNSIYFTFDEFVTDRYACKTNEVTFIRNKIEKIFFFYIVGSELAFYGANNEAQLQLSRIPVPMPKNLSGQWVTIDVNGVSMQQPISGSEYNLELCEGKGSVNYTIVSNSTPNINFVVDRVKGCAQNEIFSTLNTVKYFRWRNANLVYFYDDNSEQIMTMRKIKDKPVSATAVIDNSTQVNNSSNTASVNASKTETKTQANTTANVPKTENKTTDSKTQSNDTTTAIKPQQKPLKNQNNSHSSNNVSTTVNDVKNVTVTQTVKNVSENIKSQTKDPVPPGVPSATKVTDPVPSVPSTKTDTTTKIPQTVIPTAPSTPVTPVPQNSKPATDAKDVLTNIKPADTPAPSAIASSTTSTTAPKVYKSTSDLPPLNSTQLAGKWLITDPQYTSSTYKYFFLVVGDRITLYGDCQVHLTTFTLTNNSFDKISIRSLPASASVNSTPGFNCDDSKARIASLLQKWKTWKYAVIDSSKNVVTLQVLDSKFAVLNNLQKI